MILKVRIGTRSREHIMALKQFWFHPEDRITAGYIIGLAVEGTARLSAEDWNDVMEHLPREKQEEESRSTSLSLRQAVYDSVLARQQAFEKQFGKKLPLAKVLALILEAAAAAIPATPPERKSLTLLSWNINGRTGREGYTVPVGLIACEIFKREPDLVVLEEFVKGVGWRDLTAILEERYTVCTSRYQPGKNGILIAASKKSGLVPAAPPKEAGEALECGPDTSCPDFLEQVFFLNGPGSPHLRVIGTRITVGGEPDADFQDRARQFQALWDYVKSTPGPTVIAGDFNTGVIRNETDQDYIYPPDLPRCHYSYQHLWRTVEPQSAPDGWRLLTPDRGDPEHFSFVSQIRRPSKAQQPQFFYIKEDHLIVSPGIAETRLQYSWDFVTKENGYGNLHAADPKSHLSLPDHAMLTADLSVPMTQGTSSCPTPEKISGS